MNQRGAVQVTVVVLIAILGIAGTGAGVWYVKDQELQQQQKESQAQIAALEKKLRQATASPSPTLGPLTQSQLNGSTTSPAAAQALVKEFVLTVANPAKPTTLEQRKAAVKYLTPKLQSEVNEKYGGDPAKLLGLSAAPFDVPQPVVTGDKGQVLVTFKLPDAGPKGVQFTLVQSSGTWLIDSVTPAST